MTGSLSQAVTHIAPEETFELDGVKDFSFVSISRKLKALDRSIEGVWVEELRTELNTAELGGYLGTKNTSQLHALFG